MTPKQKRKIIPKTPYPDDVDVGEDNSDDEAAPWTRDVSFEESPVQAGLTVSTSFSSVYVMEGKGTSEDGEGESDEEMESNVVLL